MLVPVESYTPVPAPDLEGIPELVGNDARFNWIRWGEATLSVMAAFVGADREERHRIVVGNVNGQGRQFYFGTQKDGEGGYRIITGPLSPEQSLVFGKLVEQSIAAGPTLVRK